MTFLPFILKRATRRIGLLLTLALGVILSTALLAGSPLIIDAAIELSLPRKLRAAEPIDGNLRIKTFVPLAAQDYQEIDDALRALINSKFGPALDRIVLSVNSNWMFPWVENVLLTNQRVSLRYYEGFEEKVELVAGEWPAPPPSMEGLERVQVLISTGMAAHYELEVGDQLPLSFKASSLAPGFTLEVSGIIQAKNPRDTYWFGVLSPLKSQGGKKYEEQFSALIPAETFFPLVPTLFPAARSEVNWHILFNPDAIPTSQILPTLAHFDALPGELAGLPTASAIETGLPDLLLDFYFQSQRIRAPITLLTAEIVLLALYFVVMTAALSVRMIERELVTLASRGASRLQILRIQLTEAVLIASIALLSGPRLAALFVRGLTIVGPLSDVADTTRSLSITQAAWTAAWVGAGAAIVGLLLPVIPNLRRSIIGHQQRAARDLRKPLWQRLYLDVFALLTGIVLIVRVQLYGDITGGPRFDWLLLLAPLALLLGSATVLLRVFPPLLGLLARLTAAGRDLPATLATWEASRNPNRFAQLALLLTLTMALGVLSTGLRTTLDISDLERSRYLVGSDIRLASDQRLGAYAVSNQKGVRQSVSVLREEGTVNLRSARSFPVFEVLGIEPFSFTTVSLYRDDFAEEPMGQLLGGLVVDSSQMLTGVKLPGEPGAIGVRVWAESDLNNPANQNLNGLSDRQRVGIDAKIQTAEGEVLVIKLVPEEGSMPPPVCKEAPFPEECSYQEWGQFNGALPPLGPESFPLTFHSFWFRNRARSGNNFVPAVLFIAIDDITVADRNTGEETVAIGFEEPAQIWRVRDLLPNEAVSIASFTRTDPHSGEGRMNLVLNYSRPLVQAGFHLATIDETPPPLPALVSERFLAATELAVGDTFNAFVRSSPVNFEIRGAVTYFPSMYENQSAGFIVTARTPLLAILNNDTPKAINTNEVWLLADFAATSGEVLADETGGVMGVWDLNEVRKLMKADPMGLGLRSVTFLGYVLTTLLSIIGFVTHFYISVRQREYTYSILRSMGMSPRQLYTSLAIEQVLIIASGLLMGTLLGLALNQLVLTGLPIITGLGEAIPPFLPRSDWAAVRQVYFTLGGAFLIAFGLAMWMVWRGQVHQVLRIGQE